MPTQALFTPPRRKVGPYERTLTETLRDWRAREHLTGAEHAAQRAILRGLARQADSATLRQELGEIGEYSAAVVIGKYREALDDYAPPSTPTADPAAARLESAALAIIGDLDDDE